MWSVLRLVVGTNLAYAWVSPVSTLALPNELLGSRVGRRDRFAFQIDRDVHAFAPVSVFPWLLAAEVAAEPVFRRACVQKSTLARAFSPCTSVTGVDDPRSASFLRWLVRCRFTRW